MKIVAVFLSLFLIILLFNSNHEFTKEELYGRYTRSNKEIKQEFILLPNSIFRQNILNAKTLDTLHINYGKWTLDSKSRFGQLGLRNYFPFLNMYYMKQSLVDEKAIKSRLDNGHFNLNKTILGDIEIEFSEFGRVAYRFKKVEEQK